MSTVSVPKIQRLLPRHFQIIDLAVAGYEAKEIAEALELSVPSVQMILRSPLVQTEVARLRKEKRNEVQLGLDRDATLGKARSILEEASIAAAQAHRDLLSSTDPNIKLRAADKILDRVFGKEKDGTKGVVINVTAEQTNLLLLALKESDYAKSPANRPGSVNPVIEQNDVQENRRLEDGSTDGSSPVDSNDGQVNVYVETDGEQVDE